MLPKKNRVDRKTIEKIFKKGIFLKSPNLTFKYLENKDNNETRISMSVTKAVSKSSVKRNSLRRKGYMIIEKNLPSLKSPVIGIFVLNGKSLENIENEIKNIFDKIH